MKRIIKLTESDLARIVKRVINEQSADKNQNSFEHANNVMKQLFLDNGFKVHDDKGSTAIYIKQTSLGETIYGIVGGNLSQKESRTKMEIKNPNQDTIKSLNLIPSNSLGGEFYTFNYKNPKGDIYWAKEFFTQVEKTSGYINTKEYLSKLK